MKWLACLSLAIAASATPIDKLGLTVYNLKVNSVMPSLNGKYLSIVNNTVGVFPGAAALKFYTTDSDKEGFVTLHTYPIGIVDHAIGLVGSPELMNLQDLVNPGREVATSGNVIDFTSFKLSGDASRTVGESERLSYVGKGKWVARVAESANGHKVQFQGSGGFHTGDDMPIDVLYETLMLDAHY